jgi:quercetin dioxygenase-like cupin family protein
MRNFLKIADNVDVLPVVNALAVNADLWNQNTLRTDNPLSPHSEVDDIWVFFNDPKDPQAVINDIQTHPFPAWDRLHPIKDMILNLMRRVNGVQLGRVIMTRMKPGARIAPHVDGGAPATFYSRYQMALQCLPGVVFRAGDEVVEMRSGDVWWFDNTVEHEVINNSADDRIAMVVDIRSC